MTNFHKFLISTLSVIIFTSCSNEIQNTEAILEPNETQELSEESEEDTYLIKNFKDAPNGVVRIVTKSSILLQNDQGEFETVELSNTGSGFFIAENGIIVTNNHVVASAVTIDVYIQGETRSYAAKNLGSSECDDLAILKIEKKENYYFELYDNAPVLGEEILAIGFPKGDEEITFLDGIVSKKETDGSTSWSSIDFAFEHTAEILPGSSGGPVLNKDGKVLGIAYAGNDDGQEFGIPIVLVEEIINKIIDGTFKNILPIDFEQYEGLGSIIYSVDKSSNLYEFGIDGGEIITGINDLSIVNDFNAKSLCQVIKNVNGDENIILEFVETTGSSVAVLIKPDSSITVLDGHIFISQKNLLGKLENKIGPTTFTQSFKEECIGDYPNPELNEIFISDNKITDEFIHPFDNSESAFTDYVLESAKKSFLIGVKICWSKDFGNYEVLDGSVSTWSLNNDNNCSFRDVLINSDEGQEWPSQAIRVNSTIYIFQYDFLYDGPDSLEEAFTENGINYWRESYKIDGCKSYINDYIPLNRISIRIENEATKDKCSADWEFVTRYGNPETDYIINGNNQALRELVVKNMYFIKEENLDDEYKKIDCGYNLSSANTISYSNNRNKCGYDCTWHYFSFDVNKTIINSRHPDEILDQYCNDKCDGVFAVYGHFHIKGVPAVFFNHDN